MPATVQADGSLAIATMSLVEMLPLVEKAIKDGYKLDVESNIGYPQVLGSLHLVTMFPSGVEEEVPVVKVLPNDSVPLVKDVTPLPPAPEKVDGRKKKV